MFMLRCMFLDNVIASSPYSDHHNSSPVFPAPVNAGDHALKYDAACLLRCDYMHILIKIRIDNAFSGYPESLNSSIRKHSFRSSLYDVFYVTPIQESVICQREMKT